MDTGASIIPILCRKGWFKYTEVQVRELVIVHPFFDSNTPSHFNLHLFLDESLKLKGEISVM